MIVFPGLPAARWASSARIEPPLDVEQCTSEPLDALARLAQRLLPGAVIALHHDGTDSGLRLWPDGVMGRRTPLHLLAHAICPVVAPGPEIYVANLQHHPHFSSIRAIQEAGPLAFAGIPLRDVSERAVLAFFRSEGEWGQDERRLLRDLAAAFAMSYHRGREGSEAGHDAPMTDPVDRDPTNGSWWYSSESGALDAILSGLSHELNNPLTSIKSFTELLLLDSRAPEDRDALEIVRREADRAVAIVAGLQEAIARDRSGRPGPGGGSVEDAPATPISV